MYPGHNIPCTCNNRVTPANVIFLVSAKCHLSYSLTTVTVTTHKLLDYTVYPRFPNMIAKQMYIKVPYLR